MSYLSLISRKKNLQKFPIKKFKKPIDRISAKIYKNPKRWIVKCISERIKGSNSVIWVFFRYIVFHILVVDTVVCLASSSFYDFACKVFRNSFGAIWQFWRNFELYSSFRRKGGFFKIWPLYEMTCKLKIGPKIYKIRETLGQKTSYQVDPDFQSVKSMVRIYVVRKYDVIIAKWRHTV